MGCGKREGWKSGHAGNPVTEEQKDAIDAMYEAMDSGEKDAFAEALEAFVFGCMDSEGEESGEPEGKGKPVLGIMIGSKGRS